MPFINQVQHAKGTNVACSHIEVNGSPIETMADLLRPLSEYVVPGGTTTVQLTLELVGGGSAGVRRPTFLGSGSTGVVPSATEAVASIPNFAIAAAAKAAADKAAAKAAADKAAAAKACQEADDAQLAAALAASLAISGPVTPPPPPLTLVTSLATSRFIDIYNQPECIPDQLYALMTTDCHRLPLIARAHTRPAVRTDDHRLPLSATDCY